jgi:hypothetical protein
MKVSVFAAQYTTPAALFEAQVRALEQIGIMLEAGWRVELFVCELEAEFGENFSGCGVFRMMAGE